MIIPIPYGHQQIDEQDIGAVSESLIGAFLTTGPTVQRFEDEIKVVSNMKYAVAVSSGTSALHCALASLQLSPHDEVIVTDMSFVASANAVLYVGAKPVFADINGDTLNIDPDQIESLITSRTRAIIAVDYAGQLCDYSRLRQIADHNQLWLIRDGAHSLGLKTPEVDLITYSFHPVKHITTGEGGAIVTDHEILYQRMIQFRNHGIDHSYQHRRLHYYDMTSLGYNYRLTDFQCALGLSQLTKLPAFIKRRQEIARRYNEHFRDCGDCLTPLAQVSEHVYHLYVIKLSDRFSGEHMRDEVYELLRAEGLGVNVHYKPIHLHSYYQSLGYPLDICPVTRKVYEQIITLPMYSGMSDNDVETVIQVIRKVCGQLRLNSDRSSDKLSDRL